MRGDRLDPADESDDVGMTGDARPSDELDAAGKGQENEASSNRFPGSSPALLGAALRIEGVLAYRARVEAVYRQYDLDHGRITAKGPAREAVAFAMRRTEAEDRDRHLSGSVSQRADKALVAQVADSGAALARGGSAPDGLGGTGADRVTRDNGGREFRDDGPYCHVSELKEDEPLTAERLMKSREFTGKSLRGFRDTDNPDFIDDYKRTYDAIGGPTAWATPRLDMARMISQIRRHIYDKDGVDFTVLDLTGASGAQIDEVFKSLDKWASNPEMRPKSRLIILGGSY